MKFIGINGSPRKGWNTSTLVSQALEGAKSEGADIEIIDLYDLNYKGCTSCFACKRKGVAVKSCVANDELKPVLEKIRDCDGLILGSPIYFGNITGEMQSFLERLMFPYFSYEGKESSFLKDICTAFIYTMNVPESMIEDIGLDKLFNFQAHILEMVFSHSSSLLSTETYQFDDYSKYAVTMFSAEERAKRRETVFVEDCKKAFELGANLAKIMREK